MKMTTKFNDPLIAANTIKTTSNNMFQPPPMLFKHTYEYTHKIIYKFIWQLKWHCLMVGLLARWTAGPLDRAARASIRAIGCFRFHMLSGKRHIKMLTGDEKRTSVRRTKANTILVCTRFCFTTCSAMWN